MIGTDASTGRALDGLAHLGQSIADILMTPLGSRVMRRDYGSLLPELIDQPFNDETRLRLYGATAMALMRWEPRVRLTRVQLFRTEEPGAFQLELECALVGVAQGTDHTRLSIPLRYRSH
jgi:phage baseplate assembly protein W